MRQGPPEQPRTNSTGATAFEPAAEAAADPDRIRHLVVVGHPASDSFNHAIARAYCEAVEDCGQIAILRDLYALVFDPLLKASERPGRPGFELSQDVRDELELVRACRVVTLVYPIWFGMPPAVSSPAMSTECSAPG